MSSNNRKECRRKRIDEIETGGGITDVSLKQSVDVMNSVIEDLTESIDKNSKSSSMLSLIIAIATALLVVVGLADLYI